MQDRFKFRATVKGYYYIDTPDKCEEFEPLIFLENIDVLDIGDIGISEEDLEIAIRKQYPDLQDVYVEHILENFRDNSNGVDTYITITPEQIYQCTGLKDKNGKLIYEGDIVKNNQNSLYSVEFEEFEYQTKFCLKRVENPDYYPHISTWQGIGYKDQKNYEVIGNIYENPELLED